MRAILVMLVVGGSTAAVAGPVSLSDAVPRAAAGSAASSLHLLPQAAEGQVLVPDPHPVRTARDTMFLLGLGLTAGGLVLGAAGFGVLYFCGEGQSCHSNDTTVIGWALAAPGVLPLVAGLILLYISVGGRGGGRIAELVPHGDDWALTVAPTAGGASAMGVYRF